MVLWEERGVCDCVPTTIMLAVEIHDNSSTMFNLMMYISKRNYVAQYFSEIVPMCASLNNDSLESLYM